MQPKAWYFIRLYENPSVGMIISMDFQISLSLKIFINEPFVLLSGFKILRIVECRLWPSTVTRPWFTARQLRIAEFFIFMTDNTHEIRTRSIVSLWYIVTKNEGSDDISGSYGIRNSTTHRQKCIQVQLRFYVCV